MVWMWCMVLYNVFGGIKNGENLLLTNSWVEILSSSNYLFISELVFIWWINRLHSCMLVLSNWVINFEVSIVIFWMPSWLFLIPAIIFSNLSSVFDINDDKRSSWWAISFAKRMFLFIKMLTCLATLLTLSTVAVPKSELEMDAIKSNKPRFSRLSESGFVLNGLLCRRLWIILTV